MYLEGSLYMEIDSTPIHTKQSTVQVQLLIHVTVILVLALDLSLECVRTLLGVLETFSISEEPPFNLLMKPVLLNGLVTGILLLKELWLRQYALMVIMTVLIASFTQKFPAVLQHFFGQGIQIA